MCLFHDFYGFNIFTAYLLCEQAMSVRLYEEAMSVRLDVFERIYNTNYVTQLERELA